MAAIISTAPAKPSEEPDELPALVAPIWARYADLIIIVLLTIVATALRVWAIDATPPGLHGDEALTGLDAQRIQEEGWIGPYVGSALGQPTGPLYWAALFLGIFGDSAFNVRLSMALLGSLTVPVTYLAVRQMFDQRVAVLAAGLLTVMTWHLAFSRSAFMVISWPLMEMAAIGLLFLALNRGSYVLYALAGLVLGAGIYSYNVYPLFIIVVAIFSGVVLLHARALRRVLLPRFATMFACATLAALPLLLYAVDSSKGFFSHHRQYSLFNTPEYKSAGMGGRIDLIIDKTWDWLAGMLWRSTPDFVDAAGSRPMLDWLTIVLLVGGIFIAVRGIRHPANQLLLLMLLIIPIASVVSMGGGFRRSLGLAPMVAILVALPLAYIWRKGDEEGGTVANIGKAAITLVLLAFAVINLRAYFGEMGNSGLAQWVYAEEIAEASKYVDSLPDDTYVYFYSVRWSFNYETRQYLAPDSKGEDRSKEFGRTQGFDVDRSRDVVFVLLHVYMQSLEQVKRLYPGGEVYEEREGDRLIFVAYRLPAASASGP